MNVWDNIDPFVLPYTKLNDSTPDDEIKLCVPPDQVHFTVSPKSIVVCWCALTKLQSKLSVVGLYNKLRIKHNPNEVKKVKTDFNP